MELWIRSQNKHTFIKCDYITTLEKDIYGNTEYTIITEDELELGKYDSEKRLLEVLDEIQNKFKIICTDSTGGEYMLAKNLIPIVYEMPEE